MRGVSLRFFKPSVFIKSFLVSCMVFLSAFFSSCKDLAGFDPNVNGERTVASGTFSAPTGLTATNGYKQKISLAWNPVSGAKYYEIWYASSNTSPEFEKVGQTDKLNFVDKVKAGKTFYYKVRAVKSNGNASAFSSITKGTSLATPLISGGEMDWSSAEISWYMENACGVDGKSNYEDNLIFEVHCQLKGGNEVEPKIVPAKDLNSNYKWKFEKLSGTSNYLFWVVAYNVSDQSNTEQSPVVDYETLTSYIPLAPKFKATQGLSAKGIYLYDIELPEMVKVLTETKSSSGVRVDEDYPLYFEISRALEGTTNYDFVCNLYYNGELTPPSESYYQNSDTQYTPGKKIKWFDDSVPKGGEKYSYRIRSFADTNYSKIVCPEGKEYSGSACTPYDQAETSIGWKSAHPTLRRSDIKSTYSENKDEILAVEFDLIAEWNDLGMASAYKFAIKQNRRPWNADSASSGEDTWLLNSTGKYLFDSLKEIESYHVKFGSVEKGLKDESGSHDETGIYTYTLYIVSDENATTDDIKNENEGKVLDSAMLPGEISVTSDANMPEANLDLEDGYHRKVVLKISSLKKNATYVLLKSKYEDGNLVELLPIELQIPENAFSDDFATYNYDDSNVEENCTYYYTLKAISTESGAYNTSNTLPAETLGTPEVAFEMGKLAYDSVTISFNGVLAANKYVVKLGASEEFGNDEGFTITKDTSASGNDDSKDKEGAGSQDEKWSCDTDSKTGAVAKVSFAANRFTITIEKPYGYDDALLAGRSADLTVTAHSNVDSAPSEAVSVNVVGPARVNARVGSSADATEDSIWVAWDAVEGANGYLIKRVMYDSAEMTDVAYLSETTYYYSVSGDSLTLAEGGTLGSRATVAQEGNGFKLIDNYMEKDANVDWDSDAYQEAQSKIPWGLPFRYVVLPVLDKGDFEFGDASLMLEDGKVKYEYFDKTQTEGTATCGYGLNPVAEKAMSGNAQGLKWEKPYNADLRPVVYRREAGSGGSFDLFYENNSLNGKDSANLTIEAKDNFYGAFEYIVKYCSKDPSLNFDVPPSLLKEIAKNTQSYETPNGNKEEQDNKGYLLTLENFDAKVHPNTDYYEQISWKNWDYNTRAVGPDYMVIKVQNNNIDATYHEIVKITNANANSGTEALDVDTTDVTAKAEAQATIAVAPKSIVEGSAGTTNGMLKVLRDYKHNYTIELHRARREFDRQDLDGEDDGISVGSEEYADVITAYRQITDEELIKATMLILADIVKDSKMENATTGTGTLGVGAWERAVDGVTGYVDWWQNSTSRFRWRMSNYKHKWLTIPSNALQNANAFITLNDDYNNNNKGKKSSGSLQYLFNSGNSGTTDIGGSNSFDSSKLIPIYITGDEGLPECYSGTLEFAAKKQYIKVKLSRNNAETFATKEFSGTDANYWCPINLDDNGYLGQNSDYGWW